MRRFSCSTALSASLLLAACVTPGSNSATTESASVTALQSGEWRIEDIGGQGVVDNSPATLLFGEDGKLSGNASCNRLIARYAVNASKLTISLTGTTMMACPPALMDQERRLVDLLGTITSYSTDATGTLTLKAASGEQIIARR